MTASLLPRLDRLCRAWHCGRLGVLRSAQPGWTVRNELVPTPLFNYSFGLEDCEPGDEAAWVRRLPGGQAPRVLAVTPSAAARLEGLRTRELVSYHVLMRQPAPVPEPPGVRIHRGAGGDPQWPSLGAAAHEEPRLQPYFERVSTDEQCWWLVTDGGLLLLRFDFGVATAYECAVLPERRGAGVATRLIGTAAALAATLGVPLLAHVRPGERMQRICHRAGLQLLYEDRFLEVATEPAERPHCQGSSICPPGRR